ncbi:MAG: Hsp20 family protein [Clostridia bacterium]|nr:Hsp20 family protein [Clostridia bacterium]
MNNFLTKKGDGFLGFNFFNDPFEDFFAPVRFSNHVEMRTDVKETDSGYNLTIDLAGFDKKDLSLELNGGYLTVCAEKKSEEEGKFLRRERAMRCQRSYYVGEGLTTGDVKAKLNNGTLEIIVPKKQPEKITSNKIEID